MSGSVPNRLRVASTVVVFLATTLAMAMAQERPIASPAAGGVFVTPVPGIPFSATVEQQTVQVLRDGTLFRRNTASFIARDSRGRIHNEAREVLPGDSGRKPGILSIHIYDPETRLDSFLNPSTHLARQRTLRNPPAAVPAGNWAQRPGVRRASPNFRDKDLGTRSIEDIEVHGYRRTTLLPGEVSGTGGPVAVTSEYWYSEELRINILTKRNDPRVGQFTMAVKRIDRGEPSYDLFEIPQGYKIVDTNPPESGDE